MWTASSRGSLALRDSFQDKSKALFGQGLEDDPQFAGLRFVIPLLESKDFFGQPPEEVGKWLDLFEVYVNESPADGGILMAVKEDREESLIALLEEMRAQNLEYSE